MKGLLAMATLGVFGIAWWNPMFDFLLRHELRTVAVVQETYHQTTGSYAGAAELADMGLPRLPAVSIDSARGGETGWAVRMSTPLTGHACEIGFAEDTLPRAIRCR